MKKILTGVLIAAFVISATCFFGCTVKRRGDPESGEESTYEIHYYFENTAGEFVKNAELDVFGTETVGKTVSVMNPAEYDDYVPDKNNPQYRELDVVTKESTAHVEIYYARKSYAVTVVGGTASADVAKWGDTVTLTPYGGEVEWVITRGADTGATVSGNTLTMGKGAVEVSAPSSADLKIHSDTYVAARNSALNAVLDVADTSARQGVVALYNGTETQNYKGAKECYYLFASEGNKLAFFVYNGVEQVEIKNAAAVVDAGEHTYGIAVNGDGNIVCYFDGNSVLTVSVAEITAAGLSAIDYAGRTGSYSSDRADNEKSRAVTQGEMNLAQVKEYLAEIGARVSANYYTYDDASHQIAHVEGEVEFSSIYGFDGQTATFVGRINACTDIASVINVLKGSGDVKLAALKAFTENSLVDVASRVYGTILAGKIDTASVVIPDTGVTLLYDFYAGDTRWWVPNAYMLYSTWPAPDNVGIMEKLVAETEGATSLEEVYGICEEFICEVLRATAYRGMEYYYWQEYNRDSESVYNMWWYLYTYSGANGEGFEYCGNAFDGYAWDKDYRLNKALFNQNDGEFVITPQAIINAFAWVVESQTLQPNQ